MSQKGRKGKPTRKNIENAINLIGEKLRYLENITHSTEKALDFYITFKKDQDKFMDYLDEYQKGLVKKEESE
tara:strand:- start:4242 stop:4457 length:216 start_codon:yes stop_codon:yes gene_type:complete